jgi:hypothetical protein
MTPHRLDDREIDRIRRRLGLRPGIAFAGPAGREVLAWWGEDSLGRHFRQHTFWRYPT